MSAWEQRRELHAPALGYEQAKQEGYVDKSDGMKTCGNCRYGTTHVRLDDANKRVVDSLTACHMFEFWAATDGVCNEWERERISG